MNKPIKRAYMKMLRIMNFLAGEFHILTPSVITVPLLNRQNCGQFLYNRRLFDLIHDQDGDIVECGVGSGQTLLMWLALCFDERKFRHIWGFDSFEGFPQPSIEDESPRDPKKGQWNVGTAGDIHDMLVSAGFDLEWLRANVTLIKGYFEDSLSKYIGDKIALLHIDADLYQSYKTSLEVLYDKVVPGGVIAFDEYMSTHDYMNFPGASKAINEFFADYKAEIIRDESWGKYYTIKPQ